MAKRGNKQIVRMHGIDQLQSKLARLGKIGRGPVLRSSLTSGALIIQTEAAKNAAYLSGTLRRSITHEIVARGSKTIARIGTNLEYAAQREFGGTIEAKNGPWLVFQINGVWVRVRSVTQQARPFLRPAFESKAPEAVAEITRALITQIAAIAG